MKTALLTSSFLLVLLLLDGALSLFEDQAFKFDWRQQHLGPSLDLMFQDNDVSSELVVLTSSGVLAALDTDSGKIKWRQVLSDSHLHDAVLDTQGKFIWSLDSSRQPSQQKHATTLLSVRIWNANSGIMHSERDIACPLEQVHAAFIADSEEKIAYAIQISQSGALKVVTIDLKRDNVLINGTSSLVTGASDQELECINLRRVFVCLAPSLGMIYYAPVASIGQSTFAAMALESLASGFSATKLYRVSESVIGLSVTSPQGYGSALTVTFDDAAKIRGSNLLQSESLSDAVYVVTGCKQNSHEIYLRQKCAVSRPGGGCEKYATAVKIWMTSPPQETIYEYANDNGALERAWASCDPIGNDPNYQLVLRFQDGSLHSVTPLGNLMWSRDDGLADVRAVQLVSVGLHADDGSYEAEMAIDSAGSIYTNWQDRDIWSQWARRLNHHGVQLHATLTHFLSIPDIGSLFRTKDTSVDDFGIRKVIVAVTEHGKMYGIDSISGKIRWHVMFNGASMKSLKSHFYLFVQRSALHYGLPARASLLFHNPRTQMPEMMLFNPITGQVNEVKQLKTAIREAFLLHHADADHVKPILLITDTHVAKLEPASAIQHLKAWSGKMFLALTEKSQEKMTGFWVEFSDLDDVVLSQMWTFHSPGVKIVKVVSKPSEEIVHSQGRVMSDRSVLFKYINPNLGFVLAEGLDTASKSFINVYLLDLVTGKVIFSCSHKKVVGPYHMVHSENWVVYTFYNDKARRTELVSLELFEGKSQSNATVFSSLKNNVLPMVERQAFILGTTHVRAITDTVTVKGITTKHILLVSSNGGIYDVSRFLLDPRRPTITTPMELREPGLPPYIPELNFPPEVILNYNQTVVEPRGIVTSATDLESTSVVFVFGLDFYCTRVTPSKGFDLLNDDFDYYVISSVLAGLIAAAYITRRMSHFKSLKQAWR